MTLSVVDARTLETECFGRITPIRRDKTLKIVFHHQHILTSKLLADSCLFVEDASTFQKSVASLESVFEYSIRNIALSASFPTDATARRFSVIQFVR